MAVNSLPTVPATPFTPITPMFLSTVDSDLHAFLEESHRLIQAKPSLVEAVDKDLDAHALHKKAMRVADARWLDEQTRMLPGIPEPSLKPDDPRVLRQGRPRTPRPTWF